MRIAIIGSGVSGLVCAHLLHGRHDVVLYEADDRPGGHSHTHRVELPDATVDVDTGFLVYNERTYPLFCRLLDRLGVATQPSDMSFSVADRAHRARVAGHARFRPSSPSAATSSGPPSCGCWPTSPASTAWPAGLLDDPPADNVTLEEVLAPHRWSAGFRDWYLVPLGSSIWSAGPDDLHPDPRRHLRPLLRTPRPVEPARPATLADGRRRVAPLRRGHRGARCEPRADAARVRPSTRSGGQPAGSRSSGPAGLEPFDHVVVATHSDQALRLLSDPDRAEREVLGRHPLPAQPGHLAHRRPPPAAQPAGLGELELPPARDRRRPRRR